MAGSKDRCINPWFGFLTIVVVCVLITGAIFFEFRGSGGRHHKTRAKVKPRKAAVQVAFPNPANNTTDSNKLVF